MASGQQSSVVICQIQNRRAQMSAIWEQTHHYLTDWRTPQQKLYQHGIVQDLCQRNLSALNIQMTPRRKTKYVSRQLQRLQLGQGWYCYITDNWLTNCRHTVFTIHGAPGNHQEWAGLETEMGGQCRWVNLALPGLDGEDERRGDYNGSVDHFCQLIIRVMGRLEVSKIILCAHSFGSIISTYFLSKFHYLVQGYINITGATDLMPIGPMWNYVKAVMEVGYNSKEWRERKLFDKDGIRQQMHQDYKRRAQGTNFNEMPYPKRSLTSYMGLLRLINSVPGGFCYIYYLNRTLPIPQVFLFSQRDPYHQQHITQATIYRLCFGEESFCQSSRFQQTAMQFKAKLQLRLRNELGIRIEAERIQQYLCFIFKETGHTVHMRRCKEVSQVMKVYLIFLEVYDEYKIQLSASL